MKKYLFHQKTDDKHKKSILVQEEDLTIMQKALLFDKIIKQYENLPYELQTKVANYINKEGEYLNN